MENSGFYNNQVRIKTDLKDPSGRWRRMSVYGVAQGKNDIIRLWLLLLARVHEYTCDSNHDRRIVSGA